MEFKKLSVFFEITDKCNHHCFYCCKYFRDNKWRELSYNDLDKILNIPFTNLIISGGEPSLVKNKVSYVINRFDYKSKNLFINTNLSNWTKNELFYLQNKGIRFNIAIPSLIEENFIRITKSRNTFKKIKENLKYIDRFNNKIIIIANKININNIEEQILQFSVLGFKNILVQPGYTFNLNNNWMHEIENAYEKHKNLNIRTFAKVIKDQKIPFSHECDAGIGRFVILINKNIVPCACQELKPIGNLDHFDLNEVKRKGKEFFEKYNNITSCCKGYIHV